MQHFCDIICGKSFKTDADLSQHRALSIHCRIRWERDLRARSLSIKKCTEVPASPTSAQPLPQSPLPDPSGSNSPSKPNVSTRPEPLNLPQPLMTKIHIDPPPPAHTPGNDAQKVVPSELLTEYYSGAAKITGHMQPQWEKVLELQRERGGGNVYHPFKSQAEWELATWMHDTGLAMSDINAYIDLNYVSPTQNILIFIHMSLIVSGTKPIIQDCSRIAQTDRRASRSWHAMVCKNNCAAFGYPLKRDYSVLSGSSVCNPMVAGSS